MFHVEQIHLNNAKKDKEHIKGGKWCSLSLVIDEFSDDYSKKGGLLYYHTAFISSLILSAIRAMNSLFVGLPLLPSMV